MALIFKKATAQPAFTVAAAITGTTEATQTLTCAYTVVRARAANVAVRWYRHTADDGSDPTGVLLGTGSTYVLTGTDVGNYIRAIVTAINPAGAVQSTTSYTAIITSGDPPEPPVLVAPAAITGTADVGETLTVTYSFTGQDSVAIQWYSYASEPTGNPLVGSDESLLGTASTQALTESESGRWIVAVVTATNAVDSTVTSASVAMAGVDSWTPVLPDEYLVPAYDESSLTRTINVFEGDDLQAVFNNAQPGDKIVLQAGATWTGAYTFPEKSGSDWIYVVSSDLASLPAEGSRVVAADAEHMPTIRTNPAVANSVPLTILVKARKVRFVGIEIENSWASASAVSYYALVIGSGGGTDLAQDIVVDRCYIHGQPEPYNAICQNGVLTQRVERAAVVGCRIEHIKHGGNESKGIWARFGKRLTFENNYVSAASICFFIADSSLDLTSVEPPQDIVCRGNHLHKPLYWYPGDPSFNGLSGVVKNLWETKGGYRVLAEGNLLENNWGGGQDGTSVLFTPRALTVTDVTFRRNFMRQCEAGFNITSGNYSLKRLLIEDNIYYDTLKSDNSDKQFKFASGANSAADYVTIRNNTVLSPSHSTDSSVAIIGGAFYYYGATSDINHFGRLRVLNNIFTAKRSNPAVGGNGYAYKAAMDRYFSWYEVRNNVFWGTHQSGIFGTQGETDGETWINHFWPATENAIGCDNQLTGATAVAATGVWTLVGHPLSNGDAVRIPSITGGTGMSSSISYWVGDVSGATFKLYTDRYLTTPASFSTDVTNATLTAFTSVSNFALTSSSPYYAGNASDGSDGESLGADVSLVAAALNDDPFA